MAGEPKNQPPFTNPLDAGATATAPPTTSPTSTGILTVRSPDELGNIASTEVDTDIAGQVAPLQAHYDTLTGQEDRTREGIQNMFGGIMPFVAKSAENVKGAYDEAEAMQQNIFSAAMQRMNQRKQDRAAEAQALAQQIGGPVALGEFTAGMDENATVLGNLGSGQMLHTLGLAQAGVQEANAWSGRVMPLVQTEEQAKARNYFEDQKKEIQGQIDALKSQRGALVDKRKNELMVQEREFALQKTQQALDKIKSNHDWQATLRTLKNDDKRLKLAQDQFDLQKGTTKFNEDVTLKKLSTQEKQFAAQLGISQQELELRKKSLDSSTKLAQQKLAQGNKITYAQWLDAAVNPQPGKTVTMTQSVPTTELAALKDPKNSYKGNDGKWYHIVKTVYTPTTAPITNPTALVDYLVAHNVPKSVAVNMVKARLQLPDWVYGQAAPGKAGTGGRSKPGGITRPG